MQLVYRITDEAQKRHFVQTGEELRREVTIEVDPRELSHEQRAIVADLPVHSGARHLMLSHYNSYGGIERTIALILDRLIDDPGELLAIYAERERTARAEAEAKREGEIAGYLRRLEGRERNYVQPPPSVWKGSPRYEDAFVRYEAWRAEADARKAADEAQRRAEEDERERKAREERARLEADKRLWVETHGSDYLKRACAAGYDCQRRYVTERAALEFPGYIVDFGDDATWKDRSCPGEQALDEAERVGGTVVWLTNLPSPHDWEEFEPLEAVVIRNYLGKYDLIKTL